ncbi:hypothetical protein B0H10DRAFT_1813899 [Mycena sp. CBHHK59/15]|nr:hypothetical protein B0H10DRAFT_1813899 [Mycena sp. CBHHK59/15]
MVDQFTNVFLGFKRECKRGVFGRVKHYYGVFEAQNRGSLHLHILIWLEGALSPKLIQEKATADAFFKQQLFAWLESIIKHDLPSDTHSLESSSKAVQNKCLMGRPPHPNDPAFDDNWPQFLREVLDASGHVHKHNDTCFKKTPFSMASLEPLDCDCLCRFNYPLPLVPFSSMDENGKISLKRLNENVVGYNPTISGSFQCNTDAKFVGSGPLGMALSIYMSNYTAKSTIDSALIMRALAAAMKSLQNLVPPPSEDDERCRKLLLKTLNQINGRRELSGQQVACALLNIPNHVTDAHFAVFHWSKLLSWISLDNFPPYKRIDPDDSSAELPSKCVMLSNFLLDIYLSLQFRRQ